MVLSTRVHRLLFSNTTSDLPEQFIFNNNITNHLFVYQTSKLKNQNFIFRLDTSLLTAKGNSSILNNFDILSSTKTFFEFSLNYYIVKLAISSQVSKLLVKFSCINQALVLTQMLGALFLLLQIYEYIHASFTITDSVYGSVFYMLTGFHGFHVLVGTIFLAVCFFRHLAYHFTSDHHLGLEMAIWYWHFVDIVWIFLFIFVYVWGA